MNAPAFPKGTKYAKNPRISDLSVPGYAEAWLYKRLQVGDVTLADLRNAWKRFSADNPGVLRLKAVIDAADPKQFAAMTQVDPRSMAEGDKFSFPGWRPDRTFTLVSAKEVGRSVLIEYLTKSGKKESGFVNKGELVIAR